MTKVEGISVVFLNNNDLTKEAQTKVQDTKQNWFVTKNDVNDKTLLETADVIVYSKRVLLNNLIK